MKPTLSYEMHTIYTGAIYLKAVMAFHMRDLGDLKILFRKS